MSLVTADVLICSGLEEDRRTPSCNPLSTMIDLHPTDWENIMAGPKTDLELWLWSMGSFSAAKTRVGQADADGRDEPRQINQ
jgi:hypothetical protein